jgi:hypothetical protein
MNSAASTSLAHSIRETITANNGILFAKPSLVGRHTYLGRNIIAPNDNVVTHGDSRGYVPVEWWIGSRVSAGNPKLKENEGVGQFYIDGIGATLLTDMLAVAEQLIMGDYLHAWP